jgi:hypothetical protein
MIPQPNRVSQRRVNALFALADTFDPAAIADIHRRLTDDSEEVRFQAACFLAECQDASELRQWWAKSPKKLPAPVSKDYEMFIRPLAAYENDPTLF